MAKANLTAAIDKAVRTATAHLDGRPLLTAVLWVFRANEETYTISGITADDPAWYVNDRLRADLHARTSAAWSLATNRAFTKFPLSVDTVAALYRRLCVLKPDELDLWEQNLAAKKS